MSELLLPEPVLDTIDEAVKDRRLPIVYEISDKVKLHNPFYERHGKFQDPFEEFADICLENLTWAAYHLLQWKSKPVMLAPFQSVILDTLWHKTFPILLMTRGGGKSWMLALYAALRSMLTPGSKIIIVAASFRQSKIVFDYIEQFWNSSPVFQACCPKGIEKPSDSRVLRVGDSVIKALPLGNGEKIRGERATHIITDEFASIPPEIFQVVVRGFAAVSADPIASARKRHDEEQAIKEGRMNAGDRRSNNSNQIIYSGTANFQFNHFYKLYKVHKDIIEGKYVGKAAEIARRHQSEDDENAIQLDGEVDYRDYSIVQIPFDGLPKSFMDEKQIAQAQVTMPKALFNMEYRCIFPTDSDGFFKRSVINYATPGIGPGKSFSIEARGSAGCQYVMGIDPARKTDNFSISIVKIVDNETFHNVFCYSMNNKNWPHCIRKVRELLRTFNIVRIAVDSGGGGTTVEDLLQDDGFCEQPGDQLVWRYNDDDHRRFHGVHILDMVNFSPSWISESNYGLASDIEHGRMLFPHRGLLTDVVDETDEIWQELDEQKDEMCKIVVTATKTGVQHFDVPDLPSAQQGTLTSNQRKDRYSALLLSAHAARTYIVDNTIKNQAPAMGMWVDYA
jgi:hypothetical protein